MLEFVDWSGWT